MGKAAPAQAAHGSKPSPPPAPAPVPSGNNPRPEDNPRQNTFEWRGHTYGRQQLGSRRRQRARMAGEAAAAAATPAVTSNNAAPADANSNTTRATDNPLSPPAWAAPTTQIVTR